MNYMKLFADLDNVDEVIKGGDKALILSLLDEEYETFILTWINDSLHLVTMICRLLL